MGFLISLLVLGYIYTDKVKTLEIRGKASAAKISVVFTFAFP